MSSLDKIFNNIRKKLDHDNELRENLIKIARKSIRTSSLAIRHLHRNEMEQANKLIEENKEVISRINEMASAMDPSPFGIILSANQEYAESVFLQCFLKDSPLPSHEELEIPYLAYLHGIPDFVGELRRVILDSLRKSHGLEAAIKALDLMDDLYSLLITLDFPDGLTYNLRKKTDYVRNLTEKTRGDITLALNRENLINTINKILNDHSETLK
ncbi:MAG: haloacid dehalogenase [Candidatus Hodarchaeales archaeon]